VFCAMSCKKVYGPFSFQEKSVTWASYLEMLINWLTPQLPKTTSFSNRMEHRPIGTGKLEITSMQIFNSAGLAAQQVTTCHSHVGHQEVPI
jgi:hypothetical protein